MKKSNTSPMVVQNGAAVSPDTTKVKTHASLSSNEVGSTQDVRKHRKLETKRSLIDPEYLSRHYQLEALEKAISQNTIAFLETGSGKTLIAIMLLRYYAHLIRKPSKFIAVFIVPTVVLVTQQADVLTLHTDLNVGKFYGEMGVDFWNPATWARELEKYEVFVMTAQILLDNLRHSLFRLDMIKLLIFDECHHARGKSPYACIMTEFYHRNLHIAPSNLPRIFGMTASLVNSKGSNRQVYQKQILQLENLMNSKVYTVANESVLAEFIPFATMKIKLYKDVDMPYNSFICLCDALASLKDRCMNNIQHMDPGVYSEESSTKKIERLYATFLFCLTELGIWLTMKAAELLSSSNFHNFFLEQKRDGPREEEQVSKSPSDYDIFLLTQTKSKIIEKVMKNYGRCVVSAFSQYLPPEGKWRIGENLQSDVHAGYLSAKVECLIQILLDYKRNDFKCIIFAERVITAVTLQSVLSHVPVLSCWNITYMVGSQSKVQAQTRNEQEQIVDAFRKGTVNIIVATQILEEGLDVQSCNVVIRFDPPSTLRSFIQSRGRARMQGSDYVLIVRSGDCYTLSKVNNFLNGGDIMREESLVIASIPCEPLGGPISYEDFYCVESTGSIVTLNSSVALIYNYCSQLPSDGYFKPSPRFAIDGTLHLPKSCPIQTVRKEGSFKMLKQILCLEACRMLHEIGALTDYLLPEMTIEADDEVMGNDCRTSMTEQEKYFPEELVDPFLSYSGTKSFHCYKILLSQNFEWDVSVRDVILIARCNFGNDFVSKGFDLEVDRGLVAVKIEYSGTIDLSLKQVCIARRFQTTILSLLIDHSLNKLKDALDELDCDESSSGIDYLLLPAVYNNDSSLIDWNSVGCTIASTDVEKPVKCCHHLKAIDYLMQTKDGPVCSCILRNSLVCTPHNGRIYCTNVVHRDLYVGSKMKVKGSHSLTYRDYYQLRHGITLIYEQESLLGGRHLFTVKNWLHRRGLRNHTESNNSTVEIPPELCSVVLSSVSMSTLYSFCLLPSIMHRVESLLLSTRLKKTIMDHCPQKDFFLPPATKILEAITTKKCQEEFSMESLETLGDSFLKYAVSQQLFRANELDHEGLLTAKKNKLVSNSNLYKLGCKRHLPGFIRDEYFDPKFWSIPGKFHKTLCFAHASSSNIEGIYMNGKRLIKNKRVADVVEALIGVYLSTGGELAALHFLNWLGLDLDFMKNVTVERTIANTESYVHIGEVETLVNYSFHDPSLLVEALTHGSFQLPDVPRCYQRLEFLGDSVLDYLITIHMYDRYPGLSPGLLTDLRSSSVNNDCYALAAIRAGLHKHILHMSSELKKQITMVVGEIRQLSSMPSYGWKSGTDLPKVFGDVIESIAGAIFIDSEFSKDTVWQSILPLLEPLVTPETLNRHPVRELLEICDKRSYEIRFSSSSCDGAFSVTAEIEANGTFYGKTRTASNKKTAKRLAAKALLDYYGTLLNC